MGSVEKESSREVRGEDGQLSHNEKKKKKMLLGRGSGVFGKVQPNASIKVSLSEAHLLPTAAQCSILKEKRT